MLSDRNGLKAFFVGVAGERGELVANEIALIEPLCRKADSGFFDLADAREIDKPEVLRAVAVACGSAQAADVSFASFRAGGSSAADHDAYWAGIAAQLGEELHSVVCRGCIAALTAQLGANNYDRLIDAFWKTLGEPLWHSFEKNQWDDVGPRLCHGVRASLLATVVHYLGFVAIGDGENAARLRPLVHLSTKIAVLGRCKSDPGTLIAVVA